MCKWFSSLNKRKREKLLDCAFNILIALFLVAFGGIIAALGVGLALSGNPQAMPTIVTCGSLGLAAVLCGCLFVSYYVQQLRKVATTNYYEFPF